MGIGSFADSIHADVEAWMAIVTKMIQKKFSACMHACIRMSIHVPHREVLQILLLIIKCTYHQGCEQHMVILQACSTRMYLPAPCCCLLQLQPQLCSHQCVIVASAVGSMKTEQGHPASTEAPDQTRPDVEAHVCSRRLMFI